MMRNIVEVLSGKNCGYTRNEIAAKTGYTIGGSLTDVLNALIASDFVTKYVPFGMSKRDVYYKLVDPFCMFYIKFVEGQSSLNNYFWMHNHLSQSIVSWRGFAFENVCFNHIEQIKQALGISGISSKQFAWSKRPDDEVGTQIDMIIERKDNIVNMCEMKFYNKKYSVDKDYHEKLVNRRDLLEEMLPKRMAIHNTLITTEGLKYNEYGNFFDNVIVLDDLFK